MNFENARTAGIKSSASMAIAMTARKLIAAGRDIIDLSLGEPDFEPPAHVVEAACAAARRGRIRYGAAAGEEALRTAIVDKFKRENALQFSLDEITVANGAKQILFDVFLACLEGGDEVIVPTPCWVSYGDMVALHGGTPVFVSCGPQTGFKMSTQMLESAITPRTRVLMLNSPSNPTGAVYSQSELEDIGAVLSQHPRIFVVSDEIYEHILLRERPFASFGAACPSLRERTLIVNGVSKSYAMTGWRLGYAGGPKALVAAINKLQSQSVTSVCGIVQAAAIAALTGDQTFVREARATFSRRAHVFAERLATISGLGFMPPDGAFYAFIGIAELIGRKTAEGTELVDDAAVAAHLLNAYGVSSVPGVAFGCPQYIRVSLAAPEHLLVSACDRLQAMVTNLTTSRKV